MNRICFFIGDISHSGGTERVTSVIANELEKRGFIIHILSLKCNKKPFFELSKSIITDKIYNDSGRGLYYAPLTIVKLRNYIKRNNINTLIDVESMLALYAVPALISLNINHICWEHFNFSINLGKKTRDIARKIAARYCDHVVTLTNQDKELWISHLRCNAEISCIPNPITISPSVVSASKKEKLFLAVGRLTYQKGFDLLLTSWKKISESNPSWKLRIIGSGEDELSLKKSCNEMNLSNTVEIIPSTNNISFHYSNAAFFIMSSRFEGLPLVLIEAQSYGLPVISFDCVTGPRDIIIENETGWLCDFRDPDSLSDASNNAISIFENNIDRYVNISSKAILNSEKFSLEKIIPMWESKVK